jgi:hypothetical protein
VLFNDKKINVEISEKIYLIPKLSFFARFRKQISQLVPIAGSQWLLFQSARIYSNMDSSSG